MAGAASIYVYGGVREVAQIALIAVIITSSFGLIRRNASKSTPPAAKLYRDRSYIRPLLRLVEVPLVIRYGHFPSVERSCASLDTR